MSTSNPHHPDDLDLGGYVDGIRRQKWLIVATAVIGVVLGLAYATIKTPTYTATATVQITSPSATGSNSSELVSTEEIVAHSKDVADLAAAELNNAFDPSTLLKHLTVSRGVGDATILDFSYTSTSPTVAAAGANAFAHAYADYKGQQANAQGAATQKQIDALTSRISDLNAELAAVPKKTPRHQAVRTRIAALTAQSLDLQKTQATAVAEATSAEVIQEASAPTTPTSPVPSIDAFAGFLLGLFTGIVIALIRSRRGDRWRPAVDLESWLGAPILGIIPKTSDGLEVVTMSDPASPAAEAYRKLRARLFMIDPKGSRTKTLMVTSPAGADGKSVVATNLAVILGQAGKRTILVSADFRHPGVERLLGLRSSPGFFEVLSGESPLSMALQPSGVHNLWVLASGRSSRADIDVLHSGSIEEFMKSSDLVDYVVIDAAPLVSVADALVIAGSVDGVVVAADARAVKREDAIRAREELDQVGARTLGTVVTHAPKAKGGASSMRSREDAARADEKTKKAKNAKKAAGGFIADRSGAETGAQPEVNGRPADGEDAQTWLQEAQEAPDRRDPVAR